MCWNYLDRERIDKSTIHALTTTVVVLCSRMKLTPHQFIGFVMNFDAFVKRAGSTPEQIRDWINNLVLYEKSLKEEIKKSEIDRATLLKEFKVIGKNNRFLLRVQIL